jgi:hypothetical protein
MLAVARRIAYALVAAVLFAGGFGAVAWAQGGTPGKGRGSGDDETTKGNDQDEKTRTTTTTTAAAETDRHEKAPAPAATPSTTTPTIQTTSAPAPTARRATTGSRTIASTHAHRRSPVPRLRVARAPHRGEVRHAQGTRRTDPPKRRNQPGRRAKRPLLATTHAVALPVASITSGDHPRDRIVSFLPPQLSSWIGIAGGVVLILVGAVLGAGVWAKRRVLKL